MIDQMLTARGKLIRLLHPDLAASFTDAQLIAVAVPFIAARLRNRRKSSIRNPVGFILSVLRDPAAWGFCRIRGQWRAPGGSRRRRLVESTATRLLRIAREMERYRRPTAEAAQRQLARAGA